MFELDLSNLFLIPVRTNLPVQAYPEIFEAKAKEEEDIEGERIQEIKGETQCL
jgi:hypothetical protein